MSATDRTIRPAKATIATVQRLAAQLEAEEIAAAETRDRLTVAIRRLAKSGKATQNELAAAAGVSKQRISQLVNKP